MKVLALVLLAAGCSSLPGAVHVEVPNGYSLTVEYDGMNQTFLENEESSVEATYHRDAQVLVVEYVGAETGGHRETSYYLKPAGWFVRRSK